MEITIVIIIIIIATFLWPQNIHYMANNLWTPDPHTHVFLPRTVGTKLETVIHVVYVCML